MLSGRVTMARRLTPPNRPILPRPITGPMPNGDAADPPVDALALAAARDIDAGLPRVGPREGQQRVTRAQIIIAEAINEALDRCQALGGRRTR